MSKFPKNPFQYLLICILSLVIFIIAFDNKDVPIHTAEQLTEVVHQGLVKSSSYIPSVCDYDNVCTDDAYLLNIQAISRDCVTSLVTHKVSSTEYQKIKNNHNVIGNRTFVAECTGEAYLKYIPE